MSDGAPPGERVPGKLFWTRRVSLTARILTFNIIALALMAGSLFYLDSLRKQLIAERFRLARSEVEITADALAEAGVDKRRPLLARIATAEKSVAQTVCPDRAKNAASRPDPQPSSRTTDAGARRLGEWGIGTNYGIQRFSKNMLFDEKIGGTIHFAVGASYPECGGRNESGLHWDMLCDMAHSEITVDGELFYKDGKTVIV